MNRQGRQESWGQSQPALLRIVLTLAALGGIGVVAHMLGKSARTGKEEVSIEGKSTERPFNASEFKWPMLIEHLNDGTLQTTVKTDEAVFILYYLKEMNAVFGDAEMKPLLDTRCFTDVYDAEMNARLQSMFWTKVIPTALTELGAVLHDDRNVSAVVAERYPILADAIGNVSKEIPHGTLDRLFIFANLPNILKAKARQDATVLFREYGCSSATTQRIYSNSVKFVKSYGQQPSSGSKEATLKPPSI